MQGLDEDAICEIGAEVSAAGGTLAAAGAGGSHALVPLDFDEDELLTKGAEAVTVFWVVSRSSVSQFEDQLRHQNQACNPRRVRHQWCTVGNTSTYP